MVRDLAFDAIFGSLNMLAVSFLYKDTLLTGAVLVLLTVLALFYRRSRIMIPIFFFGMIFGTFAEIFAIHNGVWAHAVSDIFGIPGWLFVLWGNVGLLSYMVIMEFEQSGFCG